MNPLNILGPILIIVGLTIGFTLMLCGFAIVAFKIAEEFDDLEDF